MSSGLDDHQGYEPTVAGAGGMSQLRGQSREDIVGTLERLGEWLHGRDRLRQAHLSTLQALAQEKIGQGTLEHPEGGEI